ncbi:hypothetical protein RB195_014358 [Necator americanus]|uniref:Uncharacterized protein n=1 Tax=Necator americanus TaxID=51031 RepID=A0ABR1E2G7_NECAM
MDRRIRFCSSLWELEARDLTSLGSTTYRALKEGTKGAIQRSSVENKMSTRAEASAAADAPRSRTTTRVYSFKKYNSSGNTQLKMMLLTKTTTKLGCVRCPE